MQLSADGEPGAGDVRRPMRMAGLRSITVTASRVIFSASAAALMASTSGASATAGRQSPVFRGAVEPAVQHKDFPAPLDERA